MTARSLRSGTQADSIPSCMPGQCIKKETSCWFAAEKVGSGRNSAAQLKIVADASSSLEHACAVQVASDRFREATGIAAPNSQLGGDCKMQWAICLDSMVCSRMHSLHSMGHIPYSACITAASSAWSCCRLWLFRHACRAFWAEMQCVLVSNFAMRAEPYGRGCGFVQADDPTSPGAHLQTS